MSSLEKVDKALPIHQLQVSYTQQCIVWNSPSRCMCIALLYPLILMYSTDKQIIYTMYYLWLITKAHTQVCPTNADACIGGKSKQHKCWSPPTHACIHFKYNSYSHYILGTPCTMYSKSLLLQASRVTSETATMQMQHLGINWNLGEYQVRVST